MDSHNARLTALGGLLKGHIHIKEGKRPSKAAKVMYARLSPLSIEWEEEEFGDPSKLHFVECFFKYERTVIEDDGTVVYEYELQNEIK